MTYLLKLIRKTDVIETLVNEFIKTHPKTFKFLDILIIIIALPTYLLKNTHIH